MTVMNGSNVVSTGIINVTTAGTVQQLPNLPCNEITIIAKRANTNSIYVGGAATVSATNYGVQLNTNESFTFAVNNANLLYVTSGVSAEGFSYIAL